MLPIIEYEYSIIDNIDYVVYIIYDSIIHFKKHVASCPAIGVN